jgi:cytochrome c-type biogenesis protein CcmH/NrfG
MILGDKENQPIERQKSVSESLDQLEVDVTKLGQGFGVKAEEILYGLDAIRARLDELETQGRTAKSEEAQFEFVANTLKNNSRAFLKEIGGTKAMIVLRSKSQPDRKAWWWFLDEIRSNELKATLKRRLIWLGGIIAVLVILYLGYQRFLAPSPATQAALTYENEIENSLISGDLTGALNQANQGLAIAPEDVTLLILKGITQIKLGQTADGTQTLAQAEKLIGNQESYLLQRALIYIRSGDFKSALSDAQAVIAINPQSAEGYFYEGMAYQNQNESQNAYNAFDTAQKLADSQGKTALVATIRLDMGLLLQSMGAQPQTTTP